MGFHLIDVNALTNLQADVRHSPLHYAKASTVRLEFYKLDAGECAKIRSVIRQLLRRAIEGQLQVRRMEGGKDHLFVHEYQHLAPHLRESVDAQV
jgi:hypothetical protein